MFGFTKLVKQQLPLSSLMFTLILTSLSFTSLHGAERAVKSSSGTATKLKSELIPVNSPAVSVKSASQLKQSASSATVVSTEQSLLSSERVSTYKDVSDPALMIKQNTSSMSANTDNKSSVATKQRNGSSSAQANSGHIYFYSVGVDLDYDYDGDGYYSEFTVSFDVDTTSSYETVYASLYLSLNGGEWQHYYTTDNFQINGTSSSDVYYVSTQLTTGFPPGSYDILIDLYDAYDNSLTATISADDEYALAEYFFEDISYESNSGSSSAFSIFSASVSLITDLDNDGYYQSFSLEFDADVVSGEALVYAEIWVQDSTGTWEKDFTTEDYLLSGNSTVDTYILDTVWENGYSTGYYNFRIELYDAETFSLLATSEAQDYSLGDVPLESANFDLQPNSGGNTGTGSNTGSRTSVSHESGGGSFGFALILLMAAASFRKRLAA